MPDDLIRFGQVRRFVNHAFEGDLCFILEACQAHDVDLHILTEVPRLGHRVLHKMGPNGITYSVILSDDSLLRHTVLVEEGDHDGSHLSQDPERTREK